MKANSFQLECTAFNLKDEMLPHLTQSNELKITVIIDNYFNLIKSGY